MPGVKLYPQGLQFTPEKDVGVAGGRVGLVVGCTVGFGVAVMVGLTVGLGITSAEMLA